MDDFIRTQVTSTDNQGGWVLHDIEIQRDHVDALYYVDQGLADPIVIKGQNEGWIRVINSGQ